MGKRFQHLLRFLASMVAATAAPIGGGIAAVADVNVG